MCNIKGTDPFPSPDPAEFGRIVAASFKGVMVIPIRLQKLRAATGNVVFQSGILLQKCFPSNPGNAFADTI